MFCAHLCACWWIYQTWAWHHQPARTKQRINKVLHINTHTHTHTHYTAWGAIVPLCAGARRENRWRGWRGTEGGVTGDGEKKTKDGVKEKGGKNLGKDESTVSKNKTKYNLSRWKRRERVSFWRRRRKFFPILMPVFSLQTALSFHFPPFIPSPALSFFAWPQSLPFPWRSCKEFQLKGPPHPPANLF